MKREIYETLEQYMLSCMEDSAHDAQHIYRVLYNALLIAKEEKHVDHDVLIAACLLHDIGRKEQFADPALCHGQRLYVLTQLQPQFQSVHRCNTDRISRK